MFETSEEKLRIALTESDAELASADEILSPAERAELAKCEGTIERGKRAFIETGNALATIRDKRLYRQTHDTFRAYCQERWGFSDSRARQLIAGAKMQKTVTRVTLPDEATARQLNRVPEEQREACYESYIGLAKDRGDEPPTPRGRKPKPNRDPNWVQYFS